MDKNPPPDQGLGLVHGQVPLQGQGRPGCGLPHQGHHQGQGGPAHGLQQAPAGFPPQNYAPGII
eukprot:12919120-Prorocentrum_lima.AAC.1